jgi:hypothetical protein
MAMTANTALRITTYHELHQLAQAFVQGDLNLLILSGDPGLEKTRTLKALLHPKRGCYIEGNATAFGVYCELYRHRHEPVVIDDVDNIYQQPAGTRLLKALCQTEPVKTVAWLSDAKALDREDIPRRYTTRSPLALITNRWSSTRPNLAAIEDRGLVVEFAPGALEVHRRAGEWFWDQEIFDLVTEHLHLIARPSMRLYVLAWQMKKAGLGWRGYVLSRLLTGPALVVAQLKADPRFACEADRVKAFVASGTGCRATYFNHAKKLTTGVRVPKVVLHGRPPVCPPPQADLLSRLRQRYGDLGNG